VGRGAVDPTSGSITLLGGDELIAGSWISETLRGCPHDRTLRPCRRRRRAVTGSCLLTAQPDPTRSDPKTGPQPIDFGLPEVRFSGHPERRIFPPHGSKRFGIDLSAIKPLAGCLNAAEPESRTVNVT
jgi:hypothetical protein